MSHVEGLAKDLRFLINFAACIVIVLGVAQLFGFDTDDDDASALNQSGLRLHKDHLTGCQYFQAANGGLTPRLDVSGKQVCITKGGTS